MQVIPVAEPSIDQNEINAVLDALQRVALSGHMQDYIAKFENAFSSYCGTRYGIATSNGTTSIHLALAALGIGRGDEVLVSTYTNMATFFAVLYQGAIPIAIDVEPETWNMDPTLLEPEITPRTKAIIPVHIFGHPVDMDPILAIAKKYNLFVIEDAAQSHGALYKNRKTGSFSHAASFSFYSNKLITTGEGGMITTSDADIAERCRSFRNLCYGTENRFMHQAVGFNYRMSNLNAAVGWAQVPKLEHHISRKRCIAGWYNARLKDCPQLQLPVERPWARSVYWMYHIVLNETCPVDRKTVMARLKAEHIEVRPGFVPFNQQQIAITRGLSHAGKCPVANRLYASAFYVPSGVTLTEAQVDRVATALRAAVQG